MEDVKANNIHIAWQIPQYALITAGEVLFSITGLEFSYSQVTHSSTFNTEHLNLEFKQFEGSFFRVLVLIHQDSNCCLNVPQTIIEY